jgi:hypothetical protein
MPDGTVYAGISPHTSKAMYATPADAPLTMAFTDAKEYAAKLDAHGHKDWHVPTKAALNVLFNNRAAIGGFDVSGFQSRRLVLVHIAGQPMACAGSGSTTGIRATSIRTTTRPCGVSAEPRTVLFRKKKQAMTQQG